MPWLCVDTSCQANYNIGSDQPQPSFILRPKCTVVAPLPPPSFSFSPPSFFPSVRKGETGRGSGKGYSNTVGLASPHCPLTIKTCVSTGKDESALLWLPLFFLSVLTLYFKLYLDTEIRAKDVFFSGSRLTSMSGLHVQYMTSSMQLSIFAWAIRDLQWLHYRMLIIAANTTLFRASVQLRQAMFVFRMGWLVWK